MGKIVISCERSGSIQMEVKLDDGSISHELSIILSKWKQDFCSLLNVGNTVTGCRTFDDRMQVNDDFGTNISLLEVTKAF